MLVELFRDYDPHPGQARFRNAISRFKNIVAGRRWGKDFSCAREFIRKVFLQDFPKVRHLKPPAERFQKYSKPLLHYWAVAPDFNIGKIQQREIFSIFPSEFQNSQAYFNYDDNKKELRLLNGRILIEFKSADRPETLVGVGLAGVYCTEFARFKESAWSANIRPTLTDKRGWGLFATTPLPRKWFLDFFNYGNPNSPTFDPAHENFLGKTIDNIRLPGIEEEVALARKTLPPRYFRREYEASMEFFEGQVYEEWDANVHCPRPFIKPRFDIVIAGVDWGYAKPGCILIIGVTYRNGVPVFWVIDESYEAGVLLDGEGDTWVQRARIFQQQYNVAIWYCDSAEPGFIQAFRQRGLNAVGADKEVGDGIQSVATCIHISGLDGQPRLFVSPEKAPNVCREIIPYAWDEDKDEQPIKEDDHSLDALRYPVHSYMKYGGQTQYLYSTGQRART